VVDRSGFEPPEPEQTEGVRLIRADEAAERVGRGNVVRRKPEGTPKFGDPPEKPSEGPRPTLRFPLTDSSDPADIARPKVRPADQPRASADQGGHEDEPDDADYDDEPEAGRTESGSLFSRERDDTGTTELPHWTEPATGEVPRVILGEDEEDDDEDAEAWASLSASQPRWRDASDWDDDEIDDLAVLGDDDTRVGALDQSSRPTDDELYSFDDIDEPRRQTRRPSPTSGPPASGPPQRAQRPRGPRPRESASRVAPPEEAVERNVPMAVGVGVVIGVAALIFFKAGAWQTMILVVLVVAAAAAEFFTTIRRAGHQPAQLLGLTACVAFPLAAYWKGDAAFPLVLALTVVFLFLWYLVGAGDETPVAGMGVTLLGVGWIGALGAFAALLLRAPDGVSLLLAIALAAVAYDVGAFFVGRSIGQSPLSAASPNKTWEGVLGGFATCLLVTVVVVAAFPGIADGIYGGEYIHTILLALVVSLAGTLGDLAESVLKRDLGVKDMSSLIPGHGGVLDRFDGILIALPAGYYLTLLLV
jgi:phosphatidate cytidylyltransferase